MTKDQRFADILRGCRHADPAIAQRCQTWMRQTLDPARHGKPPISMRKMAQAVRDAERAKAR
jgi:ribosomal 50S subunit-associated protein YjgA (DUF615 family)